MDIEILPSSRTATVAVKDTDPGACDLSCPYLNDNIGNCRLFEVGLNFEALNPREDYYCRCQECLDAEVAYDIKHA
jgi:hypothetical protein